MSWYFAVLRKYAVFGGRARRREYWFFTLFNVIVSLLLIAIDALLGTFSTEAGIGILSGIYSLAIIIPSLAVSFRRLHDIGRSGWWILIPLIPLIGAIVLLVFAVQDSQPGDNQYGPNPKTSRVA